MESKIINNVILVYLDPHTVDVVSLILLKDSIFIEPPPPPFPV